VEKFDIIIIGAGIAGLSSAVTAVEKGLKTALIERESYSGGTARGCFHSHICGLFQNDPIKPFALANKGLCSRVFKFLYDLYKDDCLIKIGKVETLAFKQDDLWNFFTDKFKKNKNRFTFFKNTRCIAGIKRNNKILGLKLLKGKNRFSLSADVFINSSGCEFALDNTNKRDSAGDPSVKSMLGGFCMLFTGKADKELSLIVPLTAYKIVERLNLNKYLKYVTITKNCLNTHYILKFSVLNEQDKKKCELIYHQLKIEIPQFASLKRITCSDRVFFRDCQNKLYTSTLPNDSLDSSNNKKDCIKSFWPGETWYEDKGPKYEYIEHNKPFLLFNSALKDSIYINLFLAGKSIKVSRRVHASARVMGVCMATGEKAALNAHAYLKKNRTNAL